MYAVGIMFYSKIRTVTQCLCWCFRPREIQIMWPKKHVCREGKSEKTSHSSAQQHLITEPPHRRRRYRPECCVGLCLSHLPRLAKDAHGDHEGVEHLVLLEQPTADVGEHVQAHVVDQNPVARRSA